MFCHGLNNLYTRYIWRNAYLHIVTIIKMDVGHLVDMSNKEKDAPNTTGQ